MLWEDSKVVETIQVYEAMQSGVELNLRFERQPRVEEQHEAIGFVREIADSLPTKFEVGLMDEQGGASVSRSLSLYYQQTLISPAFLSESLPPRCTKTL